MKTIVFLTPTDARYGFSLTGVTQRTVETPEAEKALRESLQAPGTGVVVIDERLFLQIPESRVRDLERRWPGLVIVLPAPRKTELAEEDYILRIVRRAIGYQVKLNL
ncbi:V-type ATP synthase subunit F [Trichloromonas sp.]|uniref:V-type ATP synthase subunit F n=1 Tax=Trichloromonas sp. TaxID=3069249 RepID=UPI003D8126FB